MRAAISAAVALALGLTLALGMARIAPAAAETRVAGPGLLWLHGEWEGTAIMFGRPATVSISAGPVLMSRATALTYHAHIPADGKQPEFRFEGRGTYQVAADGKVTGQWNDSQGNFHPLAGRVEGAAMTVNWGEPRTETGQSTYRIGADGKLAVTDAALAKGELRVFATASYSRRR